MNAVSDKIKKEAFNLRKKGYSLGEISDKLHIAKSTSSLWLRNVSLEAKAIKRLNSRKKLGQRKTALIWKNKKSEEQKIFFLNYG